MRKIIGLGNALTDVLVTIEDDSILQKLGFPKGSMTLIDSDKLLSINELIASEKKYLTTGGSAGNAIRALACLGAETGFIGKVGKDEYGEFYRKMLLARGVKAQLLVSDELPSGVASTFISPGGERTFGTYLGAAASLQPDDLQPGLFSGFDAVFIEGYLVQDHDLISRAVALAKAAGLTVCLDLASYNIVEENLGFFTSLVKEGVDIVFANEEEAKAFTGKEPEEALDEIARLCDIAVVKIGARGSLVRRGGEKVQVPAERVAQVVDTNAAGDYFAAGFLYGLTRDCTLEGCARIGSLLASRVVQVVGTELTDDVWKELKDEVAAVVDR